MRAKSPSLNYIFPAKKLAGEIMRFILAITGAAATLFSSAHACSCGAQTREAAFRNAGLVFDGVIERIDVAAGGQDEVEDNDYADPGLAAAVSDLVGRAATFRVEREIKGVGEATRVIRYNIETGGNCGMSFETGKRYRVFASATALGWVTGACDFTTELLLAPDARDFRAVAAAEAYAKANPNDPVARWRPDRIRSEIDDEYFIRAYLDSVDIAPEGGLPAVERAFLIAFGQQDFERADAISAIGVAQFGDKADAHLLRAKALREREIFGEALAAAERALSLDPDSLDARDEAERLHLVVNGEAAPGRRDYRELFARTLNARRIAAPRADFSDSAFGEADFSDATLDGARFRRVVAGNIVFDNAKLRNSRFDRAGGARNELASQKRISGFSARFAEADLRGADFTLAMMTAGDFTGADLRGADFTKASLEQATFDGAKLDGARFAGAKFYRARMDGAEVGGADFADASAVNISWRGVDLRRASLKGADLRGGVIDCGTRLPRDFAVAGTGLIPERAVCDRKKQNRDFSGVEWPYFFGAEGFDLRSADFSKGVFEEANFRNANLKGADFSRVSGGAKFEGADLSRASFRGAAVGAAFGAIVDRQKKTYADAILGGADFSGATLEAAGFLSHLNAKPQFAIDLSSANFDGAQLSCAAESLRGDIEDADEFDANPDYEAGAFARRGAFLRRQRDYARAYLAAEGELMRYLAARKPAVKFHESCAVHFERGV